MAARNPLRAQTRVRSADTRSAQTQTHTLTAAPVRSVRSAEDVRSALIAELELHLSTTTNKQGRPFQRRTINAYKYAATQLHHWLTQSPQINAVGVGVTSFTDVDTATLNRYFRWYYETHDIPKSQDGKGGYTGGTNTTQRNLRAMFAYLAEEYEHPDPYGDPKLQRYATPPMGKPKTLSEEFVSDCLKITEWGPRPGNKEFHAVRDHALLRVLTEGLRSDEVLNLRTIDLDLRGGTLVVVPLKMDRNSTDGRTIPLQPKTVKALTRYLRVRALHRRADDEWLWLGTRNRSRLLYAGLHRMTKRRAEEAGYDPASVSPHSFCHTWADDLKAAGVSGEHIMAIRGWKSPAMLRRYGADMASRRAVDAVQSLGDRY